MKRLLLALCLLIPAAARGSQIVNPAASGAGGGGGIVSPGTFTWTNPNGMTVPDQITVSTGVTNLEQLESVANANGIQNGNFVSFPGGLTNPAVGTVIATGWTVANNTNTAGYVTSQESTITHNAKNSLKVNITGASLNGSLWFKQTIANYQEYLGSTVTLTCYLYTATGGPAPLITAAIQDSVSGSTGTTITADATWHLVTVTRFVATTATSLSVWIGMPQNNPTGAGAFYVDNVMLNPSTMPVPYFPAPSPGDRPGFTDASSATSGFIGEYLESVVNNVAAPSSNVWGDLTSLSLTAGDWDVTGLAYFENGTAITTWQLGISQTSGNSTSGLVLGSNRFVLNQASSGNDNSIAIPVYRQSLSATTTLYLKMNQSYGGGSPIVFGRLSARRVR